MLLDACETVRRSIVDMCEQDHHCDAATLEDWLGNKTEVNFKSWINSDRHVAIVAEHLAVIMGCLLQCLRQESRQRSCWTARLRPSAFYMACGYRAHRRTIASFWCCSGQPDGKESSDMNEDGNSAIRLVPRKTIRFWAGFLTSKVMAKLNPRVGWTPFYYAQ